MFNVQALLKYVLEGLAVAIVSYMILRDRISKEELLTIALTAAASFAVLDALAPTVAIGARLGTGFGLGGKLVPEGFRQHGGCGEDEEEAMNY